MNILRIKELLKDKGITGKTLAENIGITENALSMIINGKRQPRFELLYDIASYLDVDIRDLFKRTKDVVPLNGFIEYKGNVRRIRTAQDISELLDQLRTT